VANASYIVWTIRIVSGLHPGGTMPPLTIDLRGVTPDLLRSADHPVLTEAVLEAISPTRPARDGAGFDNKL
jgi:hypothetical protein